MNKLIPYPSVVALYTVRPWRRTVNSSRRLPWIYWTEEPKQKQAEDLLDRISTFTLPSSTTTSSTSTTTTSSITTTTIPRRTMQTRKLIWPPIGTKQPWPWSTHKPAPFPLPKGRWDKQVKQVHTYTYIQGVIQVASQLQMLASQEMRAQSAWNLHITWATIVSFMAANLIKMCSRVRGKRSDCRMKSPYIRRTSRTKRVLFFKAYPQLMV